MDLILRPPVSPEFHDLYCELSEALRERADESEGQGKGVPITPTSARVWRKKIHDHAHLGSII